jgi:hypothetical protein
VATYLERDLRNLLNVGSLRDFERFLRACAIRCGQALSLSELGRDVGVSTPTAKQWLSVLQASNQVFLLEPYHRSLGKRISKTPKLYFTDSGLAAFLMGFASKEALWASREAGRSGRIISSVSGCGGGIGTSLLWVFGIGAIKAETRWT